MFVIRNGQGGICGLCTNKPGPGNVLPDGSLENVEHVEEITPEIEAFQNRPKPSPKPNANAILAALIKKGVITEAEAQAEVK